MNLPHHISEFSRCNDENGGGRKRGDMLETFKMLRGMNRVEKDWFVIQEEETRPTGAYATVVDGEVVKKREVLVAQQANLEILKNFFTVRAPGEWSILPDTVKAFDTLLIVPWKLGQKEQFPLKKS